MMIVVKETKKCERIMVCIVLFKCDYEQSHEGDGGIESCVAMHTGNCRRKLRLISQNRNDPGYQSTGTLNLKPVCQE